jgi:uncharacterized protein (DUF1501 family)
MSMTMTMDRRGLFSALGAAGLASAWPRIAFASGPTDKRLVVVILRGAMDGLTAAPVYGDPAYERARNGLATPRPGEAGGALALDTTFGLHPALASLHGRYAKKELILFHAIASPYRDRSHFDGQNLLENGSAQPYGLADGWLNRSLNGLPDNLRAGRTNLGIAIAPVMPLMMRGPAQTTSWSPSILPGPSADLLARLGALYAKTDPKLATALAGAVDANAAAGSGGSGAGAEAFPSLMAAAAKFMADPNGPCAAVVESTGWNTHTNQVGAYGVLPRNLATLDKGLEALATGLGPKWPSTAVVVVTEFGRTVAMNGTAGTDHGTGTAAFLVGGAVAGGRVIADWPGLDAAKLYQGRDLRPTADLRSVLKAALVEHLGADPTYVERVVFPDSGEAPVMRGLFRA